MLSDKRLKLFKHRLKVREKLSLKKFGNMGAASAHSGGEMQPWSIYYLG